MKRMKNFGYACKIAPTVRIPRHGLAKSVMKNPAVRKHIIQRPEIQRNVKSAATWFPKTNIDLKC